MSWNSFPARMRNFIMSKAKAKYSASSSDSISSSQHVNSVDDSSPKIWLRLPYLETQGESLTKHLIRKIKRNWKIQVMFIVIDQTKKTSLFISNEDRIPDLCKN